MVNFNMEKRIEILDISQKRINDFLKVTYKIAINKKEYELLYKISGETIDKVPLLCDAVVVSFLVYAVKHGLSFYSKYPISKKLYYNLVKHVIPQLSLAKNETRNNMIRLSMSISEDVFSGQWIGTGISLGVDSFTTLHEYTDDCLLEGYKLTHLVHLKTGAHHGQLGYYDKQKEDELFLKENLRVRNFCKLNGYKLIVIESNLFEITCSEFGYGFDTTHTFRNLGSVLLLQNYFSKYYYASAYNLDKFNLNINIDTAVYEKWLIPYISNDSIEFYSANESMARVQKTLYISQFADTYDHLHVCWSENDNCGSCKKCIRTQVVLDALGVLDKYSNCFNIESYYKNRSRYLSEILLMKKRDVGYMEVYKFLKERSFKMPSIFTKWRFGIIIGFSKIKKIGFFRSLKYVMRRKKT